MKITVKELLKDGDRFGLAAAAIVTLLAVAVLSAFLLISGIPQRDAGGSDFSEPFSSSSSDLYVNTITSTDSSSSDIISSEASSSEVLSSEILSSEQSSVPVSSVPYSSTQSQSKPSGPYAHILNAVAGLDSTRHGYGFGYGVDAKNRPLLAMEQQIKYGKYGMTAITDHQNTIYLTFDEGYEAGFTSRILDVLKEKNCKATFFVTMSYVKKNPKLVKRMIDEGHIIGNHSVNHPVMPNISVEKMIPEIMDLHNYMLEHYGYEMKLFRPPTGAYSEVSLEVARLLGYRTVEWSFAYNDWDEFNQPDKDEAYRQITSKTHSGAIYLLHAVSKTNTEILGEVIDFWRQSGMNVLPFPNTPPDKALPLPPAPVTSSDVASQTTSSALASSDAMSSTVSTLEDTGNITSNL